MGEYTFRTFRKLLCATLVFSLLWPDVARCMQDDEEKDLSSSPKVLNKSLSDLKERKSSSENLKIEEKEEIKEIPPQTETIQEKKESIQSLLPKKEEVIKEKLTLTETKPKEEELKNTKTIETNPSHDPKKKEEKEIQDTQFSNNSSEKNNPEISNQITEEGFRSDKEALDIITTKKNKRNDDSLDGYLLFQEKKPNSLCSCCKGIFNCCTKKKVEMKSIFSEETHLLINKDDIEEDSKKSHVQKESIKLSPLSQEVLKDLEIDSESLNNQWNALNKIVKVEKSFWNGLIWSNLSIFIHKVLFALTTNKSAVNNEGGKACDLLWLKGGPIPLKNPWALQRNATLKTLGSAIEEGISDSLETIFVSLMGYQIYELIRYGKPSLNLVDIVKFYFNDSDTVSSLAVIKALHEHPSLFSVLAIPVAYVIAKTLWSASQVSQSAKKTLVERIEELKTPNKKWESWVFSLLSVLPTFSSLLFFHPMKRKIPALATTILWEGDLLPNLRNQAFRRLVSLAQRDGITGMTALQSLAYLAHGSHVDNLIKTQPQDADVLLKIKLNALHELEEKHRNLPDFSLNKLRTTILLWEIGQSPSWRASIAVPILKAIGLAFYAWSLWGLGKVLYEYIKCPKKYLNNFTWFGGTTKYASDYGQSCFDAYLSIFNKVPGQPPSTLVNLMDKFKLDSNYTVFNLSGAGASGEQVAKLIMGLRQYQPAIHLTQFDLRNNTINTASGMTALMDAFKNITQSAPPGKGITLLNLLGNGIGNTDGMVTYILGKGLQNLPFLEALDLAGNWIGYQVSNGTVAIGEGLRSLSHLTTLDLSGNCIGCTDSNGTVAIGEGLRSLSHLTTLDLSENGIGAWDSKGTVAIGEGLRYLSHLTTLDLSRSGIGNTDSNGTVAIGEGLRSLSHLTTLDLSENGIGSRDSNGTVAIGEGLRYLSHLTTLDLSRNGIGNTDSNGTVAIGEGLWYLTQLTTLDLSGNQISSGFSNVTASILRLKDLQYLFIQQRPGNPLPSPQLALLQAFWKHRNNQTDVYALVTPADVKNYLQSLANTTRTINLSRNFPNPSAEMVTLLFEGFRHLQNLQTLDLSGNGIGSTDSKGTVAIGEGLRSLPQLTILDLSGNEIGANEGNGTVAIGEGLRYLPHLTTLDLSENNIGNNDNGIVAIGEGLQYLSHLTTLDLSENLIGSHEGNGTVVLGEGLRSLPQLTILDLSGNGIGSYDSKGTVAIGEGLQHLPHLTTLDLSSNAIGYTDSNGTVAIGEGLRSLPHLTTLDLFGNQIGLQDSKGTVALGEGLRSLSHLTTLDLSGNWIGYTDSNGTVAIGEGLRSLPHLTTLDLSRNWIGAHEGNGTVAIGESLQSLSHLTTLDLSQNHIEEVGATYLFTVLPQLICKSLEKINLEWNNFKNISWGQAASSLQGLYAAQIYGRCAANLCSGTPIHVDLKAVKCHGLNDSNSKVHDVLIPNRSIQNLKPPRVLDFVTTENDEGKREGSLLMKKDGEGVPSLTSSTSRLVPFYQPLVNSLKSWVSMEAWAAWGDRKLDSVIHVITSYSKKVVENAPGYYPGTLDKSKSPIEGRNKTFRNYPVPHFRAIDQGEPLDVQRFNHMQALPQTQGLNHTSLPPMLTSGSQPLMLPN